MYKKNENESFCIPVYAINLPQRIERRKHLEKQFSGKTEFEVTYIEAIQHKIGAIGLWESIKKTIRLALERGEDIIIICEDDHTFTESYSTGFLFSNIIGAERQKAEILAGGISSFGIAVPVDTNRYWVDKFLATQFIVLYKPIFQKILDYHFRDTDAADMVLSMISNCSMVVYPYISYQYDFGYSDVTKIHNDKPGIMTNMFKQANAKLSLIHYTFHRFKKKQ
jgi:hypothetical protein